MFKFLSLLFITSISSLFASFHPCPGDWSLSVDFLYLHPSVDDTYFVLDSPVTTAFPNGTRENNDFSFHSGFRIGGAYAFCECDRDFQIYYTRLNASHSRTINGSFLWATVGRGDLTSAFEDYTGSASSDLNLLYQRVDAYFSQLAWCGCDINLRLLAGVEFDYFRLHEDIDYQITGGDLGEVNQKSQTWSVGPQLGLAFDYDLCDLQCFSFCPGSLTLTSFTSGSLLASKTRAKAENFLAGVAVLDVEDEYTWRLISAWHARIGLNYEACFSCVSASLEIGYEFNTYLRGITRKASPDDVGDGLTLTEYYNFDTQGLYISASFTF